MGTSVKNRVQLEAQFNRAHISRKDFEETQEYLSSFRSRHRYPLKRAILLAAIISYCRPFTASRGGTHNKATSVLSGNPRSILSKQEYLLHDKLLSLRHEALAHSSFDRKPTGRVTAIGTGFLVQSRPFDLLSESIDVKLFRSMCEKMKNYCIDRLFDLNRHLESTD